MSQSSESVLEGNKARERSGSVPGRQKVKGLSLPGFDGLVSNPSPPPFTGSSPRGSPFTSSSPRGSPFTSSSPRGSPFNISPKGVSPRGFRGPRATKKVSLDMISRASSPRSMVSVGLGRKSRDMLIRKNTDTDLETVLNNLDLDGDERVTTNELRRALSSTGLHPQLLDAAERLIDENGDGNISFGEIKKLKTNRANWILNALMNDLAIRDYQAFCSILDECYLAANHETDLEGAVLDDCNVDMSNEEASSFAAAFCSVDGQAWGKGPVKRRHTLQECSYPIMYCAAIEQVGAQRIHSIVGQEPRGQGTSEYQMDKFGKPHNPMIDLGAIATASLIHPEKDLAERFQGMMNIYDKLIGKRDHKDRDEKDSEEGITFDNFCYLKVSEGAVREYSLAYGAKEKGAFPNVESHDDLTTLLRFHFMCEAIQLNVSKLSILAATLARGGINPLTRKRVFSSETAQHCLSVLFSCGLRDLTGSFAFEIGLPAKCGRSGMIMVVIPGVGGFALHSPLVRESELVSLKGINFCHQLISRLPFHIFDSESTKLDEFSCDFEPSDVYQLIYAAANGDLARVHQFVAHKELDVNSRDYDKRTPLHLAIAERRTHVVKYLINLGADLDAEDRWGKTPMDEVGDDTGMIELLKSLKKMT